MAEPFSKEKKNASSSYNSVPVNLTVDLGMFLTDRKVKWIYNIMLYVIQRHSSQSQEPKHIPQDQAVSSA